MTAADVIAGSRTWSIEQADAISWLDGLPADSLDLVFGSPPYEQARLYLEDGQDMGIAMDTETWVAWMVKVVKASLRVSRGLVAFVVEGQTRKYRYTAGPALLMADLHRAGVNLRKPPVYHRIGIPGSGGPDWLRNDWEWIVCASRPGKLPWSENTACGHPPKWAPGGDMSHRLSDGQRVNQWGKTGGAKGMGNRAADGTIDDNARPSHQTVTKARLRVKGGSPKDSCKGRRVTRGHRTLDGDTVNEDAYLPPAIANPGNVINCKVGGGQMGHDLAHENEAPFPLQLADFFVRSFAPPGGIVGDCFNGSGTTGHAAIAAGRRYVGCDLRASQVSLGQRRLAGITPPMFTESK